MDLLEETVALQRKFAMLACKTDKSCLSRYCLPPKGKGKVYLLLHGAAAMLRGWGVTARYVPRHDWAVTLKHSNGKANGVPLLVWALGDVPQCHAAQMREICEGVSRLLACTPDYVPVLVTDVADFRYYSRLGWLVEYVPDLSCCAEDYRESKLRYLAWRYHGARLVPANAAFSTESDWQRLLSR